MLANRQRCLNWAYEEEGGYVERQSEPGGAGNLGISFKVFRAWEALNGNPKATFDDLKTMGKDIAGRIYETEWMTPLRFDELANGLDYAAFDCGVTLGVSGAIKMIQKDVLEFRGDAINGHFGVTTLAALTALDTKAAIIAICDAWLSFKEASVDPNEIPHFHLGWEARSIRRKIRALSMVT